LEHKGTAGAFARNFPSSTIYIQPGQYSFPLDLPTELFFPLGKKINIIPENHKDAPWCDEIEHDILSPIRPPGPGAFSETAFYHKKSRTLLVTDTIIKVEDDPPEIVQEDPRALLYHARDNRLEIVKDTKETRRKGWRRIALFGLTFVPAGINVSGLGEILSTLKEVPEDMKKLGDGVIPFSSALYAWSWESDERPNFKSLQQGLLVAPILQELILNREPERVLAWADRVAKWPFIRVIPCHFANNIKATPREFRTAFSFLEQSHSKKNGRRSSGCAAARATVEDSKILRRVSDILTKLNIVRPAQV
jgi:hypothetical protein